MRGCSLLRDRPDLRHHHHVFLGHLSWYRHLRSVDLRWDDHLRWLRDLSGELNVLWNGHLSERTYLSELEQPDLAWFPEL